MTDSDDNILKFCREEVDAAGFLPEPSGEHPTGALVTDLRNRSTSHAMFVISGLSLAAVAALVLVNVGLVRDANLYPHPIPPTELTAHPMIPVAMSGAPEPAIDRSQLETWFSDFAAMHKAATPPHRRPTGARTPSRGGYPPRGDNPASPRPHQTVSAIDPGCPASLSPTICGGTH
jgi:hypothetical protein